MKKTWATTQLPHIIILANSTTVMITINFHLICKGLYWSIWIARNHLIFESKALDWDMIFDLTFHRLAFWLKSSVRNFSHTSSDFFKNSKCIMNWTN